MLGPRKYGFMLVKRVNIIRWNRGYLSTEKMNTTIKERIAVSLIGEVEMVNALWVRQVISLSYWNKIHKLIFK